MEGTALVFLLFPIGRVLSLLRLWSLIRRSLGLPRTHSPAVRSIHLSISFTIALFAIPLYTFLEAAFLRSGTACLSPCTQLRLLVCLILSPCGLAQPWRARTKAVTGTTSACFRVSRQYSNIFAHLIPRSMLRLPSFTNASIPSTSGMQREYRFRDPQLLGASSIRALSIHSLYD